MCNLFRKVRRMNLRKIKKVQNRVLALVYIAEKSLNAHFRNVIWKSLMAILFLLIMSLFLFTLCGNLCKQILRVKI